MNSSDGNKRLHLKMIEDVISRMGANSFLIKGWSITSIGGLVTLYVTKMTTPRASVLLVIAVVACLIFWMVDAYYLQIERKYRQLYEQVREMDENDIDFSMELPKSKESFALCLLRCMRRPIFLISYMLMFLGLIILLVANSYVKF